jgi:hypothetical protein
MTTTSTTALRETVLHDWHVGHDGKMVDFEGWEMPVQYKAGIIREHLATRRHAGLFDVSHMGRFEITGDGAEAFTPSSPTTMAARSTTPSYTSSPPTTSSSSSTPATATRIGSGCAGTGLRTAWY